MKKILLTICIAAFVTGAFAQSISYAIKAGADLATIHYSDSYPGFSTGYRTGFHIGATADFSLHNFSIQPGLYYITKGTHVNGIYAYYYYGGSQSIVSEKASTRLSYLELPVNVLYHLNVSKVNLYFGAGPYLGYGLDGKLNATYTGAYQGKLERNVAFGNSSNPYTYNNPDFGVNFMIGERIKHISVDVNYSLGLTKLAGAPASNPKNRVAGVSVGYWFK